MNWNCGGERIRGKRNVEIIGQNGNITGRIILVAFSVMEEERLIICSSVDKL